MNREQTIYIAASMARSTMAAATEKGQITGKGCIEHFVNFFDELLIQTEQKNNVGKLNTDEIMKVAIETAKDLCVANVTNNQGSISLNQIGDIFEQILSEIVNQLFAKGYISDSDIKWTDDEKKMIELAKEYVTLTVGIKQGLYTPQDAFGIALLAIEAANKTKEPQSGFTGQFR